MNRFFREHEYIDWVFYMMMGVVVLLLLAPGQALGKTTEKQAKYVFFFIGDGLGIPQRTAAEAYTGERLVSDKMPAQGITTTYAADRFITGSAASATALGCGQKTNIGMIGMAPDMTPVKNLAELAKEQGKKVAVISSVSIDHATPAAFYAHVKKRSMYHEIDHALANSDFDFYGGGGLKDPQGKRKLKSDPNAKVLGDAYKAAEKNGFKVVKDKAAFQKLTPADGKILAVNAWLQDSGAMPYQIDTRPEKDINLAEFTEKAIELLDNPKGFFMMVEGGKIDWACHANDAKSAIDDTLVFDRSVQKALDFAAKHPDETLIVVTGDHECGGLTLGFAGTKYATNFDILKPQNVSFQKFTDDVLKPYLAKCDKSCSFEDVKPMITESFGLKFTGYDEKDPMTLKTYQAEALEDAFKRSLAGDEEGSKNHITKLLYGGYEPLTVAVTHLLNNMAGLAWTSYKHTGVPVSTSAEGVGAQAFSGYYDNTDVAKKIMNAMGMEPKVYILKADAAESLKMASN